MRESKKEESQGSEEGKRESMPHEGERGDKIAEVAWRKVKRRRETKKREGHGNGEWRERKKGENISPPSPVHMHAHKIGRGRRSARIREI